MGRSLVIRPRLLPLANEGRPGGATGQIDGYELMVQSGEIRSCKAVSHKEGFDATLGNFYVDFESCHLYET